MIKELFRRWSFFGFLKLLFARTCGITFELALITSLIMIGAIYFFIYAVIGVSLTALIFQIIGFNPSETITIIIGIIIGVLALAMMPEDDIPVLVLKIINFKDSLFRESKKQKEGGNA